MKIKKIFLFIFFFTTPLLAEKKLYEYNADIIKYENNKNLIIAIGNATILDNLGKKIYADKIIYDKKNGIIKTFNNTKFLDETGNQIFTVDLIYNTNNYLLLSKKNTKIIDNKKNQYNFEQIEYNVKNKTGEGKIFTGFFSDGSNLKSKKIRFNLKNGQSSFFDNNYTTCKKNLVKGKEECPWWSLKTSKTSHDQSTNTITHHNALLKIKKLPILYLPYLSHPDPSVKRKSGFLAPAFKSSSYFGKSFETPYFINVNESFDLTFTPRYFSSNRPMMLTELRKKFKNSNLIIDTSYARGLDKFNEFGISPGSRDHFFLNYELNFEKKYFSKNKINFQIQKVSQENYLKNYKINTQLVNEDQKKLENRIQFLSFNESNSLDLNAKVFEDLNKHDNSKYEYILPYGSYNHNQSFLNNNFNFKSDFLGKKYDKNKKSFQIINNIDINSRPKIIKKFNSTHTFKSNISNVNLYSDENPNNNSNNDNSINNYFSFAIDNSLPLYKKYKNNEEIITPKIFAKYTTGHMKNDEYADKNLYYSDIYSMNRSSNILNPETGLTLSAGFDYSKTKKNINNKIFYKKTLGIGQVFRTNKMDQMPKKSSLNNKQSSFVGFYNFSFFGEEKKSLENNKINFINNFYQNKLDLKYDFNLNKNLKSLDQNQLNLTATMFNKINTNIIFDEKNKYTGNERKLEYSLNYLINKNFYLTSSIVENLKQNLKESERYGIRYENDCISFGVGLRKDFYNLDYKSDNKSIFFSIIIKPFGNDISSNLSGFVE